METNSLAISSPPSQHHRRARRPLFQSPSARLAARPEAKSPTPTAGHDGPRHHNHQTYFPMRNPPSIQMPTFNRAPASPSSPRPDTIASSRPELPCFSIRELPSRLRSRVPGDESTYLALPCLALPHLALLHLTQSILLSPKPTQAQPRSARSPASQPTPNKPPPSPIPSIIYLTPV